MQNSPGYSPGQEGYYSPTTSRNNPPPNPRNRATTRVTLNVPSGDRRPRTPDTFERDFNSFFQRSAADMFDPGHMPSSAFHPMMMSAGGMAGGNHHPMSGFSDFASRHHNPRMMSAFPELSGFQDEFFNPNAFHSPSPKQHSPNYYSYPQQSGQGGHQNREPVTSYSTQGQNSPSYNQRSPQFSQQTYHHANQNRQMPSTKSANNGNFNGNLQSPTQRDLLVEKTADMNLKRADEVKLDQKGNQGQKGAEPDCGGSVASSQISQSDEELKTHGPSYTMFKMDNPQLEISEEFPNRERIRKLSIKKQKEREKKQSLQNQQLQQQEPNQDKKEPKENEGPKDPQPGVNCDKQEAETDSRRPSIVSVASSTDDASPSPRGVVPDWQANVQTGDHFQKRHLRAIRQGHTVHVKAEKTTESVRSGRSTVTREWRVVAPEVVDSYTISAQFDEQEKRLVITGFFDKTHDVEIK